jgi:hypothetical protein
MEYKERKHPRRSHSSCRPPLRRRFRVGRRRQQQQRSTSSAVLVLTILTILSASSRLSSSHAWTTTYPPSQRRPNCVVRRRRRWLHNNDPPVQGLAEVTSVENDTRQGDRSFSNSSASSMQDTTDDDPTPKHAPLQDKRPSLSLLDTSLGDIMMTQTSFDSSKTTSTTTSSSSLATLYNMTRPLDRLLVTANGNLQRLVSSYYDAPVQVVVEYCQKRRQSKLNVTTTTNYSAAADQAMDDTCASSSSDTVAIYDRRVQLQVYGQTFCVATSVIRIHHADCQALVESGQVGLGQLFRYYNILPEFTLLQAGRVGGSDESDTTAAGDGGFWRIYQLDSAYVSCRIHERFCNNVWDLQPPT